MGMGLREKGAERSRNEQKQGVHTRVVYIPGGVYRVGIPWFKPVYKGFGAWVTLRLSNLSCFILREAEASTRASSTTFNTLTLLAEEETSTQGEPLPLSPEPRLFYTPFHCWSVV